MLGLAAGDHDRCPQPGELGGDGLAEPGATTGDEHGHALEGAGPQHRLAVGRRLRESRRRAHRRGTVDEPRYRGARAQRGSTMSSPAGWNTTCTGSPSSIVAGSTSLIAPSGDASRFPTSRIVASSSSSTTTTLYGASGMKAGSRGGWGAT